MVLYLDTDSSPFCVAGTTSELMLLSPWRDGESSAGFFAAGSAVIGLMLARLTPLPTTPRSVTVLPVPPVVAAVDRTESNPLLDVAIWEEVKDAVLGIASVTLDAIVFTISSMAGLGFACWSSS
jgi:hypothetical protein